MCGKRLKHALDNYDTNIQPPAGGEVKFIFSYGSTKFDNNFGITVFRGTICDDCAEKFIPNMEESVVGY